MQLKWEHENQVLSTQEWWVSFLRKTFSKIRWPPCICGLFYVASLYISFCGNLPVLMTLFHYRMHIHVCWTLMKILHFLVFLMAMEVKLLQLTYLSRLFDNWYFGGCHRKSLQCCTHFKNHMLVLFTIINFTLWIYCTCLK